MRLPGFDIADQALWLLVPFSLIASATRKTCEKRSIRRMTLSDNNSASRQATLIGNCIQISRRFGPCWSQPATLAVTPLIRELGFLRSVHSQTVKTRHPAAFNFTILRASFLEFRVILFRQNSALVFGHRNNGHSCLCHRQPCTKITARRLGKTRSGQPGRERW